MFIAFVSSFLFFFFVCLLINSRLSSFPRNKMFYWGSDARRCEQHRWREWDEIINDSRSLIAYRKESCCHKNTSRINERRRFVNTQELSFSSAEIKTGRKGKDALLKFKTIEQRRKKFFFIKTIIWCLLFQVVKQRWMFSINKRKRTELESERWIEIKSRFPIETRKANARKKGRWDEETIFGNLFNTKNINN